MEIKDLNLEDGIINLFNFTLNDDSKAMLRKLLLTPLPSKESALERQHILKGFLANINLYENYSYSKIDFREALTFLDTFTDKEYLPKRLKWRLRLSRHRFYRYRSKCIQLILLLHRLHSHYITKLSLSPFPESYKAEIRFLDDFLYSFRPAHYERLIRDNKFGIRHIVEIMHIISAKKKKLEIEAFHEKYTLLEAYLSAAMGIHWHGFAFPEFTESGLSLQDFYHPMLEKPVKNALETGTNVILLTGPNMSGKSTLLRAIGLCVYLGNIGFAIPAASGSMPFYHDISIFINLNDDLQSGYSHFMTEVVNLKKTVLTARSGNPTLAIFDELFRGTNNEDALEISRATLKGLLNFPQSLFFISSHLHQLTAMEEITSGAIACHYLDCNLKDETPAFTYELKEGWSDVKIGRILFEKEGLGELLGKR